MPPSTLHTLTHTFAHTGGQRSSWVFMAALCYVISAEWVIVPAAAEQNLSVWTACYNIHLICIIPNLPWELKLLQSHDPQGKRERERELSYGCHGEGSATMSPKGCVCVCSSDETELKLCFKQHVLLLFAWSHVIWMFSVTCEGRVCLSCSHTSK